MPNTTKKTAFLNGNKLTQTGTASPSISVVMIAKNEEQYLPRALMSVVEWVDEIILVDTGSTDRTVVIAQSFGALVHQRPWQNDFSLHRNQALELASGDWCLQLDADEELDQKSAAQLRELVSQTRADALLVNITNIMSDGSTTSFNYPRVFRKKEGIYYYRKVHNQIHIPGVLETSPIVLYHHGYAADDQTMGRRHERRVEMMRAWVADEPHNWESHYYLAQTLVSRDETAMEAADCAQRSLDLAKQRQIKPEDYAKVFLPLSQALNILNKHQELFLVAKEWSSVLPGNPDPRLYGARAAYGMNQWDMVAKISDEFVLLHRQAVRLQQQGKPIALNSAGLLYSVLVIWCIAETHLGNQQKAVEIILAIKSLANASQVIQLLFEEADKQGLGEKVKSLEQKSFSILLPKHESGKPFRILSLYFGRNANLCLLEEGKPELLIAKERISGIRYDQGHMMEMLPDILSRHGWDLDSINLIALNPYTVEDLNGQPFNWELRGSVYNTYRSYHAPNWTGPTAERTSSHKLNLMDRQFECIAIDRHLAHISLAFFSSPFDEAGVLSADGGGHGRYLAAAYGKGNHLEWLEYDWGQERKEKYSMLNPCGAWAAIVNQNMGLPAADAAELIMNLAAYGKSRAYLRDHLLRHMLYYWDQPFPLKHFNQPDKIDINNPFSHDLCASVQSLSNELYLEAAGYLLQKKASPHICLSGSGSLNTVINTAVHCSGLYTDSFVPAQPHGAGLALGQALYVWHQVLDKPRSPKPLSPYLGADLGPPPFDRIEKIVGALKEGKIVALAHGKAESGPYSLGHRSILADLRNPKMRRLIGQQAGRINWYQPIGCMVLEEDAKTWFQETPPGRFGSYTVQIRPEKADQIPAVTHVDGSTRPMMVGAGDDPMTRKLLEAWKEHSGIGVLLNAALSANQGPLPETLSQVQNNHRHLGIGLLVGP